MRRQLLRARRNHRQFRTIGVEAADIRRRDDVGGRGVFQMAVGIFEQTGLTAGHGEIHVRQNLGVKQRAVQRAMRIVHVVAPAQRIEIVLLSRMHAARELEGIHHRAEILDALRRFPLHHHGQLIIKEADIERRVVDDQLRALDEFEQVLRDVSELRLVRHHFFGDAVHLHRPLVDLAPGIDVLLVAVIARPPVDQLHTADFNDPVALGRFEAGGFSVENYLAHEVITIIRILSSFVVV